MLERDILPYFLNVITAIGAVEECSYENKS
jgi:hypothetical protein